MEHFYQNMGKEFFGKDKIEAREICWIHKKQIKYVK